MDAKGKALFLTLSCSGIRIGEALSIDKSDVYLDEERRTKDMDFLKREKDYNLTFLKEIKEMSHAELYTSSFALVLHIKSLNKPI